MKEAGECLAAGRRGGFADVGNEFEGQVVRLHEERKEEGSVGTEEPEGDRRAWGGDPCTAGL